MNWYKNLQVNHKVHIREVFELATGQKLADMTKIFSFSECMDILYNKLKMEGFELP